MGGFLAANDACRLRLVCRTRPAARGAQPWAAGVVCHHPPWRADPQQRRQCTASSVYHDALNVYMGVAAHCSSTGGATDANGVFNRVLAVGDPGNRQGGVEAREDGVQLLADDAGGPRHRSQRCQFNDFALVELDGADAGKVNPPVPY